MKGRDYSASSTRYNARVSHKEIHVNDLEREAVDAARARPPAEKLLDGLRLFDRTCRIMVAGIAHEHPGADRTEILRILRERLLLARQLEGQ